VSFRWKQPQVPLLRHAPLSLQGVKTPPGQTPLQSAPVYPLLQLQDASLLLPSLHVPRALHGSVGAPGQ
jgi:hypothetical protein